MADGDPSRDAQPEPPEQPADIRSSLPADPSPKRRRRWHQFGLRALLIVVTLAAAGAWAWRTYLEPYRRQRAAMETIERLGGRYSATAASPWLRWLVAGDLQNVTMVDVGRCEDPAAYLDSVTHLPALEALAVGGPAFNEEHLARLHGLSTLRGLVLDGTSVTDGGLISLAAALPGVEVYQSQRRAIEALRRKNLIIQTTLSASKAQWLEDLGEDYFTEADRLICVVYSGRPAPGDVDVADVQALTTLSGLHLQQSAITDAALAYVKNLTNLRDLEVHATQVGDAGLAYLEPLTKLQLLSLGNTRITDTGLVHLKGMTNLQKLALGDTRVTDAGLATLKGMISLQSLGLDGTKITDAGLVQLTELTNLQLLSVGRTQVSDAGLVHLKALTKLQGLGLHNTRVSDAGLVHLEALPNLQKLWLIETNITDAGLPHLKGLANPQHLHLQGTKVTRPAVEDLRRALPYCKIEH